MMDLKKMCNKKMIYVGTAIFVCLFTIFLANTTGICKDVINTNASGILSNKKISWGIRRKANHEQPDVGTANKSVLEQYDGICMGNSESKKVYLTFDAGYEAGYMDKILEVLKQNNVKACFFITGHYLNTQPELVKRMIDDGHIVGNHTVNHKCLQEIDNNTIKKEVMDLHTAVFKKFGYEMKYLRPPKGEFSERTIDYTNSLGYKTVMWSLAYDDWEEKKQGRESYGKSKVLDNIHNGAIILLHSTSKDNSNILNDVIKEVRKMGYEFESLDNFE